MLVNIIARGYLSLISCLICSPYVEAWACLMPVIPISQKASHLDEFSLKQLPKIDRHHPHFSDCAAMMLSRECGTRHESRDLYAHQSERR